MAVSATQPREVVQQKYEMLFSIPIKNGTRFEAYKTPENGLNAKETKEAQNELRIKPVRYQIAIPALIRNPEEQAKVRGLWGYLDGIGIDIDGLRTPDKNGELVDKRADPEQTVRV